ncbi:hypothetical protein EDB81DRAFT_194724 [Dactylonectria macrodidyma]|uniref:Uncharacterized protein n=1 Tax=Dactylonectria macrodidyma TaxID=307937 RepID=A0A9P9FT53_9HYPO|nr:hypothetical protein EDB81DRAFT_194724 [Dactylonectria macrodidyma]
MANLGNVTASLLSAKNENTVALVNLNLDVSLYRGTPPVEFLPVGSALAAWRKTEAEGGDLHKTACRLGFLFNELVPETPNLIRCYGTRVSEIMNSPNINPRGTFEDGPFRDFVGADGTCIWAAATSIPASLSTFLLACMLARAWDAKKATSIWAELVHERIAHVEAQLNMKKVVNPHTEMAIRQNISRADLAKWDASARAWLRRADQSMVRCHDQFQLIMNNVKTPFVDPGSTFEKVTRGWIRSMKVLEDLLRNVPQEVPDRAVLMAISAWHLYPDLLACQDKTIKVTLRDPLFPQAAILTLGLEPRDSRSDNLCQWSLALSHLRYYGGPIKVRSEEAFQRVSFQDLWVVALGALLRQWQLPSSSLGDSIIWFKCLGKVIKTSPTSSSPEVSWILKLCDAAATINQRNATEDDPKMQLVRFGWWKATHLFGSGAIIQPPFFGLCKLSVIRELRGDDNLDFGFRYIRQIGSQLNLRPQDAIAFYTCHVDGGFYVEWATILPVDPLAVEGSASEGKEDAQKTNARWIYYQDSDRHPTTHSLLDKRQKHIQNSGELCTIVSKKILARAITLEQLNNGEMVVTWEEPPPLFGSPAASIKFKSLTLGATALGATDFCLFIRESLLEGRVTRALASHGLTPSLAWLNSGPDVDVIVRHFKLLQPSRDFEKSTTKRRKVVLEPSSLNSTAHPDPLDSLSEDSGSLRKLHEASIDFLISIRALELATIIYRQLPTATVSLKVIDQELSKAHWIPTCLKNIQNSGARDFRQVVSMSVEEESLKLSRCNVFAAIAMFESGFLNIDSEQLSEVVALCSEDSIFVSGILLSDPVTNCLGINMRHLVGNIGQAGMVFMVAPMSPQIRPPKYDPRVVRQHTYDGKCTDKFKGTSLHLSFTNWKFALDWNNTGEIDQQVFLMESVISVQDKGQWVADIDVLELERSQPQVVEFQCDCYRDAPPPASEDILSLESWEEILDPPPSVGVIRSNKNWVARLAAITILAQQSHEHGSHWNGAQAPQ